MNIRGKIVLGHLTIVFFMGLAGYFGLKGITSIRTSFDAVHNETIPTIEALQNLRFSGLRIVSSVSEFGLIMAGKTEKRSAEGKHSAARQGSEEERLITEGLEGYRAALEKYTSLSQLYHPEDKDILSRITAKGAELRKTGLEVVRLSRAGQQGEKILDAKEDFETAEKNFLGAINTALDRQKGELENRKSAVERAVNYAGTVTIVLSLLAGAAAFIIGWLLSRNISAKLLKLRQAAAKIEIGDFGARLHISTGDELGQLGRAFNTMAESLSRTTEQLNGVIQNMADMLVVTDRDGVVIMANRSFTDTLGYSAQEIIGTPAMNLFHGGHGSLAPSGRAAGPGHGIPTPAKDIETWLLAKDGRKVPALVSTSAQKGENGELHGTIAVMKDMTSRKELEARFMQAEKIAAIGQLAAGIAHEINNPIGIILGFAQSIVKRAAESDPLTAPLRSIEREALRCKNFVQGILTFSRASGDEQLKETDINSVVEAAAPLIEAQCKTRGVELVMDLAPGLERIPLYHSALQQATINLCGNAIDAMPADGTLTIKTFKKRCENGECLALEISDTGCGIPKESLSRIFEPFFTTKEPGKGTGLGLALVYESVRRHGGRVEVKSEAGRGSTFTVLLPIKSKPAAD